MNLLFICSRNKWRSPTAENIYKNHNFIKVKSAGIASSARIIVSSKMIQWSDIFCAMENKHKKYLCEKFRSIISSKPIYVLDIPDEYGYMDSELVDTITELVDSIIAENM